MPHQLMYIQFLRTLCCPVLDIAFGKLDASVKPQLITSCHTPFCLRGWSLHAFSSGMLFQAAHQDVQVVSQHGFGQSLYIILHHNHATCLSLSRASCADDGANDAKSCTAVKRLHQVTCKINPRAVSSTQVYHM